MLNESRNAENHVAGVTILFDCAIDLSRDTRSELVNISILGLDALL